MNISKDDATFTTLKVGGQMLEGEGSPLLAFLDSGEKDLSKSYTSLVVVTNKRILTYQVPAVHATPQTSGRGAPVPPPCRRPLPPSAARLTA